jgi:MoxR-like ATPase
MLAIYVRVRCGIPVVLMGECGCGKTFSISESLTA